MEPATSLFHHARPFLASSRYQYQRNRQSRRQGRDEIFRRNPTRYYRTLDYGRRKNAQISCDRRFHRVEGRRRKTTRQRPGTKTATRKRDRSKQNQGRTQSKGENLLHRLYIGRSGRSGDPTAHFCIQWRARLIVSLVAHGFYGATARKSDGRRRSTSSAVSISG